MGPTSLFEILIVFETLFQCSEGSTPKRRLSLSSTGDTPVSSRASSQSSDLGQPGQLTSCCIFFHVSFLTVFVVVVFPLVLNVC